MTTAIPNDNGFSNLTPKFRCYKITAAVSLKAESITEVIALVNRDHKSAPLSEESKSCPSQELQKDEEGQY